jgi:hypothetical protein
MDKNKLYPVDPYLPDEIFPENMELKYNLTRYYENFIFKTPL